MTHKPIAVITGAGRGIGAETARLFAREGYAVCINYLANAAAAGTVHDAIVQAGGECLTVQADVATADGARHLFDTVDQTWGRLAVLVNNVGVLKTQARLVDMTPERVRDVLLTNVMSCFLCSQAAVRRMSTRHGGSGGAIVNVSSGAAKSGSPNEYVDYAASKGAMDSMTRGLALEVAEEGIRVNAVRPGLIHTDLHADGGEPGRVERLSDRVPLRRGGQPEEVAEAIYWLASDKASFVTGSFIDPCGGL